MPRNRSLERYRVAPPAPRPQAVREFLIEAGQSYHNLSVQGAAMHLGDVMTDLWEKHDFTQAEAATVVAAFAAGLSSTIQDETDISRPDFGRAMADMILTAYTNIAKIEQDNKETVQ